VRFRIARCADRRVQLQFPGGILLERRQLVVFVLLQ